MGVLDEAIDALTGDKARHERRRQAANVKRGSAPVATRVPGNSGFEGGSVRVNNGVSDPVPVSATFTPSGTQDVNLTQVGGAAVALGQAAAAASIPVVLPAATTVPVSAAALPLPSGAATSALQQTDALTDTQLRASPVVVDTELPAAAALSDTLANPTTPIIGGALLGWQATSAQFGRVHAHKFTADGITPSDHLGLVVGGPALMFNGATFDRVRGDTTNGVDVDVVRSALPSGAATAANQQTDALTDTQLRAVAVPVSAASLPLPTGAATLAEQQTQTSSLSVMDDWDESDRAKVNTISGEVGITGGAGAVTANTTRVAIATNANTVNTGLSQPLTDTQLRASAVPVSMSSANLTYGTPSQATVGAAASNIAASTTGFREVLVKVDKAATNGICINANGAATASHFSLDPGDVVILQTAQAVSAIRNGAADALVYVMVAT